MRRQYLIDLLTLKNTYCLIPREGEAKRERKREIERESGGEGESESEGKFS